MCYAVCIILLLRCFQTTWEDEVSSSDGVEIPAPSCIAYTICKYQRCVYAQCDHLYLQSGYFGQIVIVTTYLEVLIPCRRTRRRNVGYLDVCAMWSDRWDTQHGPPRVSSIAIDSTEMHGHNIFAAKEDIIMS